ncbi:MAG: hypothetical protein KF716_26345 [Anaerolineae bacterium]|nr:hypothetical protein [Anaerolineae bacterium]
MSLNDLLLELDRLTRAEKLHVIQHLAHELESEERVTAQVGESKLGKQYDVWSPQDAGGAVATLHRLLQEHDQDNHDD